MSTEENFRYFLLGISLLGFLCCLDRSDFNVPLGLFGFLIWSEQNFPQKHRVIWMILFSLIGDLFWILIVSVAEWQQEDMQNNKLRGMTQAMSIVNMVYKLGLVFYAVNWIEHCEDVFSCRSFKRRVLYL